MLVVQRFPFVNKNRVDVVDKRGTTAEHRHAPSVDVLRVIDFVPELGEVRHVKRNAFVRHHGGKGDDGLRDVLLVDGDAEKQVDEVVVGVVEVV